MLAEALNDLCSSLACFAVSNTYLTELYIQLHAIHVYAVTHAAAHVYLLRSFSHDSVLEPGFASSPDMLSQIVIARIGAKEERQMDSLHLNAIAVLGKIALEAENGMMDAQSRHADPEDIMLVVGEHRQRRSVRELLAAWNKHCTKLREAGRVVELFQYGGLFCNGYNIKHDAPVYRLINNDEDEIQSCVSQLDLSRCNTKMVEKVLAPGFTLLVTRAELCRLPFTML